jgi:TATA-binding protein-associated factor
VTFAAVISSRLPRSPCRCGAVALFACFCRLAEALKDKTRCTLVITSYGVIRRRPSALMQVPWSVFILDEGHTIQNPRAAITTAVKTVVSDFRVVLTGTPIQNHVLDVWSLFDFLMPGYLGTHADFNRRQAASCAALV